MRNSWASPVLLLPFLNSTLVYFLSLLWDPFCHLEPVSAPLLHSFCDLIWGSRVICFQPMTSSKTLRSIKKRSFKCSIEIQIYLRPYSKKATISRSLKPRFFFLIDIFGGLRVPLVDRFALDNPLLQFSFSHDYSSLHYLELFFACVSYPSSFNDTCSSSPPCWLS